MSDTQNCNPYTEILPSVELDTLVVEDHSLELKQMYAESLWKNENLTLDKEGKLLSVVIQDEN